MTPEEMEQAFRTWWAESYRVPANGQAVSTAVAWGMHLQGLLGGGAEPKGRGFAQIQAVVTDDRNFQVAGPLGALGVLSAWGFSRRLRRRIRRGG